MQHVVYDVVDGNVRYRREGSFGSWDFEENDCQKSFDNYQDAFDFWSAFRADLKRFFDVELACRGGLSISMAFDGFGVELVELVYDNDEDFENGEWSGYEVLEYAEYTYDNFIADNR